MTNEDFYVNFGFPLDNLPREGRDVTHLDLANTLDPLLRGVASLLEGLAEAHYHNAMNHEATCHALMLLEGQVHVAVHVLDRWLDYYKKSSHA